MGKYALTRREVMQIVMRRLVEVDHKVRTDITYPAGFMDVITIQKTDEKFRLLFHLSAQGVAQCIGFQPPRSLGVARPFRCIRTCRYRNARRSALTTQPSTMSPSPVSCRSSLC